MNDVASRIANFEGCGYVTAPAGYGKTHAICEAVLHSEGRQLILTHTYAGVNAITTSLKKLKVPSKNYYVNTLAGWALKLCLSYPNTSGFTNPQPQTNAEWLELYNSTRLLLNKTFIRKILSASYAGLLVDEYQDCQTLQHSIVLDLSEYLPTRVLGDPLQGIFEFQGQQIVDWQNDVENNLEAIGVLNTPHRWLKDDNPALATWLQSVRENILQNTPIPLNNAPECVDVIATTPDQLGRIQQNTCRYFALPRGDTAVAIHAGHFINGCHSLAKNVSGKFHSIEQVEGKAIFEFISELESKESSSEKLLSTIVLLKKVMTAVNGNLPAGAKRGEHSTIRANTPNVQLVSSLNNFIETPTSANLDDIFTEIRSLDEPKVYRRDLLNRLQAILKKHKVSELSLIDCAHEFHREFRHYGRPTRHPKCVSTTLLVKGQQFDHAIVLDAAALSKKELYVALTRGSKTLKIITTENSLNPQD
ncbi:UvrD-helicase domain-containing protein [Hellea balneolensis]|uniref:UvrD-helicase domain-containing protein n=1 Tax=Hellea balneolensis TaxID=287478 RepID=UPI00040EB44C|nr:UvrD-helicase domain-containing protein [Hellea balneolensis]